MNRTFRLSWLMLIIAFSVATPALADTYYAYSQAGIPVGADIYTWCDETVCIIGEFVNCDTPEGGTSMVMDTNLWAGWGVFLLGDLADLTAFESGDLRFFVKTEYDLKVEFQCKPSGAPVTYTTFIAQHGWDGTNTWQEIVIPIEEFFAPDPVDLACLGTVNAPIMTTIADLPFFNSFYIDYARWESSNTHSGASSVEVQGRQLLVDGEPFVVNGMDYAPISIGDDWRGAWTDRADRYSVDFPLIADSGANAVRLYAPIVSKAILDAAWAEGLHVIPTFGVDGVQLTCPEGRAFMEDRFVEMVNQWKEHPAILLWLVGNEVNANLAGADLCTEWYPQLDSMAAASHTAEGGSFHPVGTAVGGMDDICVPTCSDDTTLPNVDLWGTQLYRGCSFGTAFTEYANKVDCDRPLIVTEFGVDSWDGQLGAEDETMQADCMETLLVQADQALAVRAPAGVSSGQIIFEWADEWWKAECDPGNEWFTHDTCTSWIQGGYPDPNINEEWWGMVALDPADPDVRTPRAAHDIVTESWYLGMLCDMQVVSHDPGSGDIDISFVPAAGSTDNNMYYGPLSAVSSYGYSGSVTGLGATGSSSLNLPAGSLFWVVVPRNNRAEGSYGSDSACLERPSSPGSVLPREENLNSLCECP